MIWSEELSASLDYLPSPDSSTSRMPVVVFHRVELNRVQQLTQSLADKVSLMVEANEKALDNKLGNTGSGGGASGWDREAGGQKGERKAGGEEGKGGRGERASRGGRGGRGGGRAARFAQGLGSQMVSARS